MKTKVNLVVIGNGMVGHAFLEKLVKSANFNDFNVVVFGEEKRVAYDRVYLSAYFSGKTAQDLCLVADGFYEQHGIDIRLNQKVTAIDNQAKTVTTQPGLVQSYDVLVMATGSYPFLPPIAGNDREACLVYRTIEDLEAIDAAAKTSQSGVVIGGGLLGLEAAKALKDLGLHTHVVEFAPRLMPVQLDEGGAAMLKRKIGQLGVDIHTSKATQRIEDGEHARHRLVFSDGEQLETDLILFSAGIRPRDELAKQAGLVVGSRGGIVIDDHCKTSDPHIYAIGECALHQGIIYGLVAPGYVMAQSVVDQLNHKPAFFSGADMSTKLKLMGVDVASIGDPHGNDESAKSFIYENGPQEIYKKLVVSPDGKKLLGAVLVGDTEDYGNLLQIKLNDMDLPEHPDDLILPSRSGAKVGFGPDALPLSVQLCSCYDVSKGNIIEAIEAGATCLADIKASTQACTGCGGCTQLVTSVVNFELEKRGVEVSKNICEHFAYSRQELYHLVQVNGYKTFDALLHAHGEGEGCDICKPAVGSILGSIWNAYALDKHNIPLQDTNDRYLGNMQKNGTYSVIPRVPGGEITPQKLIVLGEVAKDYGLYTKINGGQRIVLFGAQLSNLPTIWQRLIAGGFESGQAYAKALRTVKSCVGSTWCRYGIDDSVGLAIEIEDRYKGVRSPHKMKMGVSGCTRECAEAQAKDFGVIATENGWNLFVCGNGGMKPRHADLFAVDLDRATLIKYIDRLVMFYIQTADRLQRTATWLDNMEGGIDYLRQVIIEDSLGICEQLEAQMQALVDSYECDWKRVVDDPEKTRLFYNFVNADQPDPNQVYVRERGQLRPANAQERLESIALELV
ncbi:MAG: nitrite reductase large subunit [Thiomicrospira sp.]|uniref:nitrite reductase large subunit NirB n=1 Tax=Thiomicrospira sp. TaxID=935 RepID=UPI0019E53ED2|nr:nitrite reductase large subunit NirB [Thiomicrospira sp.]MBE0494333.1 nitrite reductase large subunit [Thiomicrospira sp.]